MILRSLSTFWASVAADVGDHLWQSTVFVVLAAILAFALRKNQARVRYWVWLAASVKFVVPFTLLITLGSHLAKPRVTTPAQTAVYSAVEDFSQPFAAQETLAVPQVPPSPNPVGPLHRLPATIVAVWLGGAVVVFLVWATSWIRVSLIMRRAAALAEGPEVAALRRMEARLDRSKPIRLLLSQDWMEPGIFGIFRPVLIWPEGISQHLDDRHIDAIMAHEICHARRRDNLTAVVHMFVEAIFWFHPLVWWVGKRQADERERACDEEVGLLCQRPQVYAESILRVCKFCSESPLACVSGITGADLKKRIVQIMMDGTARRLDVGRKLLLIAAGLAMVGVPILLGQAAAEQQLMHVAINVAPKPLQIAAHAMIAGEDAAPTGEIAEVQPSPLPAQELAAESSGPAFEVATVRPASDNDGRHWWGFRLTPSGRLNVSGVPLKGLVGFSSIHSPGNGRVSGGPSWAESQKWDITAEADPSKIPDWERLSDEERMDHVKPLLLKLVVERFHLKLHTETRTYSVYAMVPAKGGVKVGGVLKRVGPPPPADPQELDEQRRNGKLPLGSYTMGPGGSWLFLSVRPYILASQIAANCRIEGTVVDQSGLEGYYDLTFKPDQVPDAAPCQDQVEAQLGLRFESKKVPLPTYVIDSAEKPSVDGAELSTTENLSPAGMTQEGPTPTPIKFDVVSFRRCAQIDQINKTTIVPPGGDSIARHCQPMLALFDFAFGRGRSPHAVKGEPDWVDTDAYDFQAKVSPADVPAWQAMSLGDKRLMVQDALVERLHLKTHFAVEPRPVYNLVVAKGGPNLSRQRPTQMFPRRAAQK